jgi:hypothetical protein
MISLMGWIMFGIVAIISVAFVYTEYRYKKKCKIIKRNDAYVLRQRLAEEAEEKIRENRREEAKKRAALAQPGRAAD